MAEPKRGVAYEMFIALTDLSAPQFFRENPTIATGDFQISKDGGAFFDLTTLPVVTPALSNTVKINLSAAEMTADKVVINGKDVADDEWADFYAFIDNPTNNIESLTDIIEGDHQESSTRIKIFKKGTFDVVLDKVVTGSLLSPNVTVNTKEP
jgi:hypothetical protein